MDGLIPVERRKAADKSLKFRAEGATTSELRDLLLRREFTQFCQRLPFALQYQENDSACVRALGGDALALLLDEVPPPKAALDTLIRFVREGLIVAAPSIVQRLGRAVVIPALTDPAVDPCAEAVAAPARRLDCQDQIVMRRVVRLEYQMGQFAESDVIGIRRSVFRSPQERSFCKALALRFPALQVLPNYPLDQVAELARLSNIASADLIRYGARCKLDAVLVVPEEGDAVAAFELDSATHDALDAKRRDRMKDDLLRLVGIPLFRLRADDPASIDVDEWYALLTDHVEKVDVGRRLRLRRNHTTLVPA